jgi:hypothetical protein
MSTTDDIEPGTEHWDDTRGLDYCFDDGGRAASGRRGFAGDCVVRAVAIAGGLAYDDVYARCADGMGTQRVTRGSKPRSRSARNGIAVRRKWFRDYMAEIGAVWTPAMHIGSGCTVRLLHGELPMGRLSRHYSAVIDGVIRDNHDPTRATLFHHADGHTTMSHRCVYGWWTFPPLPAAAA